MEVDDDVPAVVVPWFRCNGVVHDADMLLAASAVKICGVEG